MVSIVQHCGLPARLSCRIADLRDLREKFVALERDIKNEDVTALVGTAIHDLVPIIRMLERAQSIATLDASIQWTTALEAKEKNGD